MINQIKASTNKKAKTIKADTLVCVELLIAIFFMFVNVCLIPGLTNIAAMLVLKQVALDNFYDSLQVIDGHRSVTTHTVFLFFWG